MAGQQGQPKYGFGWPDGRLDGLGPPGQREARPLLLYMYFCCFRVLPDNGMSVGAYVAVKLASSSAIYVYIAQVRACN